MSGIDPAYQKALINLVYKTDDLLKQCTLFSNLTQMNIIINLCRSIQTGAISTLLDFLSSIHGNLVPSFQSWLLKSLREVEELMKDTFWIFPVNDGIMDQIAFAHRGENQSVKRLAGKLRAWEEAFLKKIVLVLIRRGKGDEGERIISLR